MGKGGRAESVSKPKQVEWKSPYNPLDKDAPPLPTKGQIKAVIPEHCFERSYFRSMLLVVRDFSMTAAFAYAASKVLSTDLPTDPLSAIGWVAGWSFYAFWMGT